MGEGVVVGRPRAKPTFSLRARRGVRVPFVGDDVRSRGPEGWLLAERRGQKPSGGSGVLCARVGRRASACAGASARPADTQNARVAPTFLSADKGDFPVASPSSQKAGKHGTRKSREPAGRYYRRLAFRIPNSELCTQFAPHSAYRRPC